MKAAGKIISWPDSTERMRRDYHNWYSHRLGRNMELLAYGHAGLPILVFPTSQGRFYEYENSGMIHAIWQKIEARQPAGVLRGQRGFGELV